MRRAWLVFVLLLCVAVGCGHFDKKAYTQAVTLDTESSYKQYMADRPNGAYVDDANKRATERAFEAAQSENTVEAYESFINRYRNSAQVADATAIIDKLKQGQYDALKAEALDLEKKLYWLEAFSKWFEANEAVPSSEAEEGQDRCVDMALKPTELIDLKCEDTYSVRVNLNEPDRIYPYQHTGAKITGKVHNNTPKAIYDIVLDVTISKQTLNFSSSDSDIRKEFSDVWTGIKTVFSSKGIMPGQTSDFAFSFPIKASTDPLLEDLAFDVSVKSFKSRVVK